MRYAILASLLLHVLLLWPTALRPPAREAPVVLQATVRIPLSAPAVETPRLPAARAVPSAPTPVPVPAEALPRPLESNQRHSVPLPSAMQPSTAMAPAQVSPNPPPSATAPATAIGAATEGSLMAQPGTGELQDGLRGYRLAVAGQARRFKRYPAEARAAGWTGNTEVRLEIGAEGRPRPATVSRSSGHETLDRAALAMIDAGAQRARLPDGLRGHGFAVLLPVVFSLDEE